MWWGLKTDPPKMGAWVRITEEETVNMGDSFEMLGNERRGNMGKSVKE